MENPHFDSVVAFSDVLAFEIISLLAEIGRQNIQVVGFDAISRHLTLPIEYPSVGMCEDGWAKTATSALLDKIENNVSGVKTLIDVSIYEN